VVTLHHEGAAGVVLEVLDGAGGSAGHGAGDSEGPGGSGPEHAAQHRYAWALRADPAGERTVFLGDGGWSLAVPVLERAERVARLRAAVHRHEGEADPEVRTPMPGTVVSVAVEHGQRVEAGQALVSVEAMKMEHQLVAALAGTVELHVAAGALVKADQIVATVEPDRQPAP
jgi:acetyl-CoA/propionyl-CoA carboxylase biotin carboxyl carrier protein